MSDDKENLRNIRGTGQDLISTITQEKRYTEIQLVQRFGEEQVER